ncbi:MAG: leucine-rich repeat protein, partial [Treponema sp.]|nr:leucine-rich repeat protein [Treponema sp.]
MATYNINISDLATTLQNADANTVDTPHTINISEITQNDVDNGTIRTCLLNNPTKYVIINILAGSTVTDVSFLFGHYNTQPYCTSLIGADISALTNATTAQYTFQCCTNIKSANISKLDKVTRTQFCFAYCTSLKSVYCDNLYSLRFAGSMFNSCSSLTDVDVTSFRNVIAAEYLFYRCTALTEIDTSGFVSLNSAREMFNGCTALTEIDISSMNRLGVLSYMFQNCTNLETITLPDLSSVTEAGSMFNGCSSLEEIHGWSVPLTATMTDCFTGCTSLQAIYVPEVVPQESTWHAWDIKKDTANTRSDVTIYGTSGIPVTAQIPSSGTYSLEVSGMTDELLFSSTKAITSAHIQKMMQTQTPITGNTDALDPTKDNFVMLAKDRTAAKTNVTTDVVEAGNLLPPTSAAVHAAIAGGIPTGTILDYPGTIAPAGFALCIGQTA